MLLLCIQGWGCVCAQQDLGVRNSNYAGVQGALLNPSAIADSKLTWDVNVLSVNTLFANNFLYAPKSAVPLFGFRRIIKGAIDEDLFDTHFDPQNPNKQYNVTLSTEVLGPSFFMTVAKKHEIGLTIAARGYANVQNITGNLAENAFDYFLNKSLWNQNFQDNSVKVNFMGWMEYGLHYATVLYAKGRDELKGGISLNYLQGYAAAYAKNARINYTIQDTTGMVFTNTNLDYGRTDYGDYAPHGHGVGADIGFTYVHLKDPSAKDYLYRIGISLLDLGSINFKRNASAYHLQTGEGTFSDWHEAKFANNAQVDRTLSAVFYNGDSSASLAGNHFRMGLPAALSLQGDWNVYRNFFANVTVIKGFGHADGQGVVRPDVYSLTPRYETKWGEVSLPASLLYYGHWQPRLGLAMRLGFFFIGGDEIGPLLKLHDLQGVDFYAGVHFFLTKKQTI